MQVRSPAVTQPAAIFQTWDTNSEAFLSTLQTCFNWAVAGVDHPAGSSSYADCEPVFPPPNHRPASAYLGRASPDSRVFLATVPDDPEYAYGARQTHLWRYPVTFLWWHWGDNMYSARIKLCHQYFKDPVACYNCSINALAHPNVKGAQFFRDSLISIFKSAWATGPG